MGSVIDLIITILVTRLLYSLIGFNYSISEGILNIKLLIDLGMWLIVYFPVSYIRKRIILYKKR